MIMVSSNKQIILLFILPLMITTVYSAALQRYRRQDNTTYCDCKSPLEVMIEKFYCTSKSLKGLISNMVDDYIALPAENDVEPDDQQNINQIMQQLNFTCKTFTTAMAIKHQLQYSIFSGTYYLNYSNGTQVQVTSEEDVGKFTSILQYIETIGDILQNIEKSITNKLCIVFSSDQFKKLYWNLTKADNMSLIKTLKYVKWTHARKYPIRTEWTNGNCIFNVTADSACNKTMNTMNTSIC